MKKFRKRAAIGSIPEVPAESCNEIKASEEGCDGKYWLSSIVPGTPVFAYCDMKTGDVDECTASTPVCGIHFNCINTLGSYRCEYNHSCQGILTDGKQKNHNPTDGLYTLPTNSTSFQAYCDMTSSSQAWTLIARFANNDAKNWMQDSGKWWYDRSVGAGHIADPSVNTDMLSPAFWLVRGREFKITRSNDPQHTALLQTTSDCLGGKTFRAKITSYGNFRNGRVWAENDCQGNCNVQYGGQFQRTDGFRQFTCNGSLQNATQVGFWCDWAHGDGAVLMIGGGGKDCGRADHGIGITEAKQASFLVEKQLERDFGNGAWQSVRITKRYSLNLWVN
ncbi:PREDICTED: intelectin-2-like [Acropora digitifera]|uniref:intelectin-2-like n=1 Tax=Acropora digitifera TaxID=70779 RepID=UPI00077A5FB7|nr:PREDICTED: intelectin-2-like [Acropora digitifera]